MTTLILTLLALLLTLYAHELGHFGKRIEFGLPYGARSVQARFRYGGLVVNGLIAFLVFYFKPENLFLQLFGLFNFLHFTLYLILGSFNNERLGYLKLKTFDDVENKYGFITIPVALLFFYYFGSYYLEIIKGVLI